MREYFERLGFLAAGATVILMFGVASAIFSLKENVSTSDRALLTLVSALASPAVFRGLSQLLFYTFQKNQWLRKKILGRSFLEGTWIGYYRCNDTDRFTVEHIGQETGEILLTGFELEADGTPRADWSSKAAFYDPRSSSLRYLYSCDVYERNNQHSGIGMFKVVYSETGAADSLVGYAVDMIDAKKDPNTEFRISERRLSIEAAYEAAKERFLTPKAS